MTITPARQKNGDLYIHPDRFLAHGWAWKATRGEVVAYLNKPLSLLPLQRIIEAESDGLYIAVSQPHESGGRAFNLIDRAAVIRIVFVNKTTNGPIDTLGRAIGP